MRQCLTVLFGITGHAFDLHTDSESDGVQIGVAKQPVPTLTADLVHVVAAVAARPDVPVDTAATEQQKGL